MIKYLLAAFFFFPSIGQAQESADAPIVLELFTSQSCSSCPPADKILGDLADENKNIIALSCNVTYWNHLHWEDTLSKDFCTQRQRNYVTGFGKRSAYTPQLVINGKYEMVGSQGRKVNDAIKNISAPLKNISITRLGDNFNIELPDLARSQYVITIIENGARHTQTIPSGENRGRTVNYTNPVQAIDTVGTWDGEANNLEYFIKNNNAAKAVVVLVHERSPTGKIVAAGKLAV